MKNKTDDDIFEEDEDLHQNFMREPHQIRSMEENFFNSHEQDESRPVLKAQQKRKKKGQEDGHYVPSQNDFEDDEEEEEDEEESSNIEKKNKQIRKQRNSQQRTRKTGYDKWTDEEKNIFWIGHMQIIMSHPLIEHSWKHWKVDGCFKKMEPLFQGKKSHRQIKSFDQRMKLSFLKRNMDITDAIIESLEKPDVKLRPQDKACLQRFKSYRKRKLNEQNSVCQNKGNNDSGDLAMEEDDASRGLSQITKELTKLYEDTKSDRERVKSIHQMLCLNHR